MGDEEGGGEGKSELTLEAQINLYSTSLFDSEPARLEAVRQTGLLDTTPESRFDSLTSLAASLFDVPVAIVNLLDAHRGWYKSSVGMEGEIQREYSACSYISVPDYAEMIVSEQCNEDSRYSENPYIKGPPDLRYYVGCPLVTSTGQRLGTLCLCDFRPRRFSSSAYNVLANLAEIAAREAERDSVKQCTALAPASAEALFMVDVSKPNWPLVYCNQAWVDLFDLDADPLDQGMWDVLGVKAPEADVIAGKKASLENGDPANIFLRVAAQEKDASPHLVRLRFFLAGHNHLDNCVPVIIPGVIPTEENAGYDLETLSLPLTDLWIGTAHKMLEKDSSKSDLQTPDILREGISNCISPENDEANIAVLPQQQQQESRRSDHTSINTRDYHRAIDLLEGKIFNPRYAQAIKLARKPHRFAGLKLGALLGVGAYGRVYRAMLGNKSVAVKIIEIFLENQEEEENQELIFSSSDGSGPYVSPKQSNFSSGYSNQCSSAMLEGILSRDLAFPTIVPTFDFFIQDVFVQERNNDGSLGLALQTQQVWIIQHLCDLGTLYQALDRGLFREEALLTSPPSLSKILATALDIATALRYLHERGIIHSDLNGNNVLMSSTHNDRGFIALVSDFGLSRIVAGQIKTKTVGTLSHQPPELINDGRLTQAADTFAFGVLLYELWNGKRAFAGRNMGYIILQISTGKPCFVLPDDGNCPEGLRQLVADCVKFDDEQRPTFEVIVSRLEDMIKEHSC